MRATRAGIIGVGSVIPDMRATRVGHIYVYSLTAPPVVDPGPIDPDPTHPTAVQARGGAVYLDSFLEYDGRYTGSVDGLFPGVTVTLSGGTTWGPEETLTLTASASVFSAGDVGNVIILHTEEGTIIRFTIVAFTTASIVTGTADVTIPVADQDVAVVIWDRAVDLVAGLEHLEGRQVGILADDHVVGSPYNARITIRTVVDGEVELGDFYAHVYVGLPYLADLETLDIDKPSGSTYKTTKQAVTNVGLHVLKSRSVWVGGQPPTDDATDPVEGLMEMPAAPVVGDPNYDAVLAAYETLTNEYQAVNVDLTEWNSNGRVFVRSIDPVPSTVLAAIPTGMILPTG